MLPAFLLPLSLASATLAADLSLPAELFSPLVAQKVIAAANTVQNPPKYPQWTDRTSGQWQFFNPDTWTSGFFPTTLYALNERLGICPTDDLKATDWLLLGQTWSAAEVPSETKTGVGHDVGFLSFPFIEELAVYVDDHVCFASSLTDKPQPSRQSNRRDGHQQLCEGTCCSIQSYCRLHQKLGCFGSHRLPGMFSIKL